MGRVENCQAVVFLAYCGRGVGADRPRTVHPGEVSGGPGLVPCGRIVRVVKAGVPFKWVTGEVAYGCGPGLREWLQQD